MATPEKAPFKLTSNRVCSMVLLILKTKSDSMFRIFLVIRVVDSFYETRQQVGLFEALRCPVKVPIKNLFILELLSTLSQSQSTHFCPILAVRMNGNRLSEFPV